jgi:hypothetical protein
MSLIAYHNDKAIKSAILKQLRAHAEADEIVKGQYWEDGKGCAVGCTIHGANHAEYESSFGIPQMLAHLEDCIFEGLPNVEAKKWPVRFMSAIEPGQDLSLVGWKFLHWLLTNEKVNPRINDPLVRDAVKQCADVLVPLTKGEPVDKRAAKRAAHAAWSAADAAEDRVAGRAAWSAAWGAWSAAKSADCAAESMEYSAERAAYAAERVARSPARSPARSAAYILMSKKLIKLIKDARENTLAGR